MAFLQSKMAFSSKKLKNFFIGGIPKAGSYCPAILTVLYWSVACPAKLPHISHMTYDDRILSKMTCIISLQHKSSHNISHFIEY
jgi:hypothetical protein